MKWAGGYRPAFAMLFEHVVCPVSKEKADSAVSRLTVLLNVVLMAGYFATRQPLIMVIVAGDCACRAFFRAGVSPLNWGAKAIARSLRIVGKPVDLAPKVFASRLGFVCAVASAALGFGQLMHASFAVTGLFMTLALLDAVCNFCVGCVIYTYLVLPLYRRG